MERAYKLIDFINKGVSAFHVAKEICTILNAYGFKELELSEEWSLKKDTGYYVTKNESAVFAFWYGTEPVAKSGFKIIAAHSDSPTLKIKPHPSYIGNSAYHKLHVEQYGSAILSTWFDRPLSVAGRVYVKDDTSQSVKPILVDIKEPIAIIPNLAIHLNRSVNEGVEIKKHIDTEPLLATVRQSLEQNNILISLLSKALNTVPEDIIDFDLNLYEANGGCICGINNEFISSGRLDDLEMVYCGLEALLAGNGVGSTKILAIFDNEEVGSNTKQGAGSPILKQILNRIVECEGGSFYENFSRALSQSFMISADMAHAVHPNKWELHDSQKQPILNSGPVIKYSANQKYTTDSQSAARFIEMCIRAGVTYQQFTNRSDMAGGSTLGNVSVTQLEIESVDVGNPMLAMHSIRELGGVEDINSMIMVFKEFWR